MSAPANHPLADLLLAWNQPAHAVMDGAKFPDLPVLLAKVDIQPRSLFVEQQNPATIRSGPHFATLTARQTKNLFLIEGIADATVFWRGDIAEDAAFRHLRSLLYVKIPRPPTAPFDPFAAEDESVLFRHWDPSVIALVLPILTPPQRARLFGPLRVIALQAKSLGGPREAKWRADWPAPPSGRLKLTADQMAAITDSMASRSRQAIADYLRNSAPGQTSQLNEPDLLAFVTSAENSGAALGLKTERGFGQWAYLLLVSKGRIQSQQSALKFISNGRSAPDQQIDFLLLGIAKQLFTKEQRL